MKRRTILLVGMLCVFTTFKAQNAAIDFNGQQESAEVQNAKHSMLPDCKRELRIGAGDNMVDMYVAAQASRYYNLCNNYITPNIFLDYTYHICHWFSLGVQINTIWWGGDASELTLGSVTRSYLYGNTAIMPTFRFTYFRVPTNNIALYSSVYGGYCAGIEKEGNTCYYNHGWSVGVTALGVSFGGEHWFGAAELGALFGYAGNLQLGSRIVSMAVGYRF